MNIRDAQRFKHVKTKILKLIFSMSKLIKFFK
jgi:hypothetical protein